MLLSTRRHQALAGVLAAGLILRILVIIADASLGFLAQPDIAALHHERALTLAQGWLDGRFAPLSDLAPPERDTGPMRALVAYLLVPFYLLLAPITGTSPVPGRVAIAVYSLALAPLTYVLVRELGIPTRTSFEVAGFAIFWPSVVYRSVVIQREVFIALATLVVVWVAVRWARRVDAVPGLAAGVGAVAIAGAVLFVVRPENLLVVAGVLAAATAVRYRTHVRALAATGALAVGIVAIAATNLGTFIAGRASLRGVGLTPATLDHYAHLRAHGNTAYLTWLHYESWLDVILFLPLKVIYFLGSPMLWSASGVSGLLAGASGLALLGATALAIYGAEGALRRKTEWLDDRVDRRAVAVLAAFLVIGVGSYAVIEMNGGAAFRRRITFVPVILVLGVLGVLREIRPSA